MNKRYTPEFRAEAIKQVTERGYSPTGGTPNGQTWVTVSALSKSESAAAAAIKKANPRWNFVILEIK